MVVFVSYLNTTRPTLLTPAAIDDRNNSSTWDSGPTDDLADIENNSSDWNSGAVEIPSSGWANLHSQTRGFVNFKFPHLNETGILRLQTSDTPNT